MDNLFSLSDVPGHISYILIAISYYLTNIFWLRVTAVIGLFFEIVYFQFSGGNLQTGIAWDVIFILINVYQLFWLVRDRLRLRLPDEDAPLLQKALYGLNNVQIARLLKASEWKLLQPGAEITRQDEAVTALSILCHGKAQAVVDGVAMAQLEDGAFVGEIAYLTGSKATATVVVSEPARVLSLSRQRMRKVIAEDPEIEGMIYQLLGRDLADKLRRSNERIMKEIAGPAG